MDIVQRKRKTELDWKFIGEWLNLTRTMFCNPTLLLNCIPGPRPKRYSLLPRSTSVDTLNSLLSTTIRPGLNGTGRQRSGQKTLDGGGFGWGWHGAAPKGDNKQSVSEFKLNRQTESVSVPAETNKKEGWEADIGKLKAVAAASQASFIVSIKNRFQLSNFLFVG